MASNRIPQQFIDDLLNRIDIVDVIDSRVKLRKAGKNFVACCPFHKEKTPSFTVSPDKQFYYCFGCGASGTALSFVIEYDRLGFVDAVEQLARNQGLEVPRERDENAPAEQRSHNNLYSILQKAQIYFQDQLKNHPNSKEAVTYLKGRGLSGTIAKTYGLGYAPPAWDGLKTHLGTNEEDQALLETAGLVVHNETNNRRYDRFRHRIMFPILDVRGRTIGFGGRVLASAADSSPDGKRAAGPKYLNSPETPVFHKGRELYGLYQARQANRTLERLIVVEGYLDVIALAQFGITSAVATLGTACGELHLQLAFKHTSEVVFCFDGDDAGRKAAKRALENSLPEMKDGRRIRFLFLPEGQDPDSLVRQIGPERFSSQLESAVPLEDFFFEAVSESLDMRTMEGRARMSKLAAPLLHRLPQGVYRELMFNQLAQRTGLSQQTLLELVREPASLVSAEGATAESALNNTRTQSERPAPPAHPANTPVNRLGVNRLGAPATVKRTLLSPVRLACTLLLENPELLTDEIDTSLPDNPDDKDLDCLKRLIAYLRERPRATFHSILGYWGGQYGLAAQRELTELVASQFLGGARKTANYNCAQELRDALARIRQEETLKQQRRELAELASLASLSTEQKTRLRQLLATQAQTRMKPQ